MIKIKDKEYEHIKLLGKGAQGEVKLIEDIHTKVKYALKIYSDIVPEKSIEREISILTQRSHPNLLEIIDCGTIENSFYTITKFAPKGSLDIYIENGELTLHDRLLILRDALVGLEYIHNDNIVHRDIKPANIFIEKEKEYKGFLGDFGLAKSREDSLMEYSACGGMIGTVAFLTPEYLRNETRTFDAKSDLYAIGVSLYKCITGYYPYGETEQELLENLQNPNYKPPVIRKYISSVPKELQVICERSLAIDKQKRFSTARQFIMNIEELLKEEDLNYACPKPGDVVLKSYTNDAQKITRRSKSHLRRSKTVPKQSHIGYIILASAGLCLIAAGYATYNYFSVSPEEKKNILVEKARQLTLEGNHYLQGTGNVSQNFKKAFLIYNDAAKLGNSEAQKMLASIYYDGKGIKKDNKKAFYWYKKSAENGNLESMIALGDLYTSGEGTEKSKRLAFYWFNKAFDGGNYARAHSIGYAYIRGQGTKKDIEKGISFYLNVIAQGKGIGYSSLGDLYMNGDGLEQNYEKAIELYEKAIEKGNEMALISIAAAYMRKTPQDLGKSEMYCKKAVEIGIEGAKYELAALYLTGKLGSEKIKEGAILCKEIAESGHSEALALLGQMYLDDNSINGIDQDIGKALELLNKSVELGSISGAHTLAKFYSAPPYSADRLSKVIRYLKIGLKFNDPNAMNDYANLILQGKIVGKDVHEAYGILQKAVKLGGSGAMISIGHMYLEGRYKERDINTAMKHYEKAGKLGNQIGYYMLGQLYDPNPILPSNMKPKSDIAKSLKNYYNSYKLGYVPAGKILIEHYTKLLKDKPSVLKANELVSSSKYLLKTKYMQAARLLGDIYFYGYQDIEKDYEKACEYYEIANIHSVQGMHGRYGKMLLQGKGTKRNTKKAFEIFNKGAEYDDITSLKGLTFMYSKGIYVEKNINMVNSLKQKLYNIQKE